MTTRTKINIHVGTLSMEFRDTFVNNPPKIIPSSALTSLTSSLWNMSEQTLAVPIYFTFLKFLIQKESQQVEEKLLNVHRKHKKAICWTLDDLLGINPFICMYKILLEEDAQPIRLNPTILDVVKKEVTKLLAAEIIYSISDSQWVSPVQVLPKKSRMTIIKNWQDEMVLTRIQNS
ncbi:hypothetical protein CR513_08868, partial [Mucuna pruriens]